MKKSYLNPSVKVRLVDTESLMDFAVSDGLPDPGEGQFANEFTFEVAAEEEEEGEESVWE